MRFSIVEGRPGYDPSHQRRIKEVLVDGIAVDGCIEADEEAGYALRLAPDLVSGGFHRDPAGGFSTLRVAGRVEIRLAAKGAADWDETRKADGAKVRVGRDANGDVLVQVYSVVRPGAIRQMRLLRADLPSSAAMVAQKAGLVAGAAAEHLCEQFRDTIDPEDCARVAVEQCSIMLAAEAKGG